MLAEISAGIGSLKAAFDITKGLNAANTQANVNEVKIALQQLILEAQEALAAARDNDAAAADSIRRLEQEIVRLKDWEREKERYELKAITPRAYAYTIKPGMESGEDSHWLCQPCFDAGHKAVLQWTGKTVSPAGIRGTFATWGCSKCGREVQVGRNQSPSVPEQEPEPPPQGPVSIPRTKTAWMG